MEIVFERVEKRPTKTKRHSVIIKDHTYLEIIKIQDATGMKVEDIVEKLLTSALSQVVIKEERANG